MNLNDKEIIRDIIFDLRKILILKGTVSIKYQLSQQIDRLYDLIDQTDIKTFSNECFPVD